LTITKLEKEKSKYDEIINKYETKYNSLEKISLELEKSLKDIIEEKKKVDKINKNLENL